MRLLAAMPAVSARVLRRPGRPARVKMLHMPAPIGGDDSIDPGTALPAGATIYTWNVLAGELGLTSRLGYREWVTGLDGDPRTLIAYTGSTAANSRLFATTSSGIWDCSSSTAAPTKVFAFGTQNDDSGWGKWTVYVNAAGFHFLVYCDEANGAIFYAEQGATWTAGGIAGAAISGVDATKLVDVLPWKNRLLFVERGATRCWYTGIQAVSGALTSFVFGSLFKQGGALRTLGNWTGDGGQGVDDRLVVVSDGGDALVWQGTDIASTAFGIQGRWAPGALPAGRRLLTENGGESLLLTSTGLVSMQTLTAGNSALDRRMYQTARVANTYRQMVAAAGSVRGWALRIHPTDSALVLVAPVAAGAPTSQLVMSLTTKGWHRYRDMPMGVAVEPWGGAMYFGSGDGSGRVFVNDGYVDGVSIADPNAYTPIGFSFLSRFDAFGTPQVKRAQQIELEVLTQGGPLSLNAEARYDLDMSEAAAPASLPPSSGSASTWDDAKWDEGVWQGGYAVQKATFGAWGEGREMALAVRGSTTSRMTFVRATAWYDVGGAR